MSADLYLGTLPIRIYMGIELLMYSGPNSVMCLIIKTPVYFGVAERSPSRWPSEHQPMIMERSITTMLVALTLFIFN